ncbi:predicted protein [Nematostella vectensis]|uniref:Mannosylglycerate hydrolase MGH1-like glycoside hydrolase domain-containing protein n=1 Tax=Nematostella vectensis TaxID=45351 RepID=A7S8Q7_NEMVE|nr:predicted protein [Nematostella vectensis]|eukprot:XP_001631928.1 predicted protein [Nematostella vectensis]
MFKKSSLRHHQSPLVMEHSTEETKRLKDDKRGKKEWKRWGPYLTERQWGTVREDYSHDGNYWDFVSHDQSRSRIYRWGEDGLLGITDNQCQLCFALGLWNGKDPIIKERLFGLTDKEGNHGEDVKECYYYLDSTPTHSYMKALYKYPQEEFPYCQLIEVNKNRTHVDPEFELLDTGIFEDNKYWDVQVEYVKSSPNDILINLTLTNRGPDTATLHVLPTLWYRNTWIWGCKHNGFTGKPFMVETNPGTAECNHGGCGKFVFVADVDPSGNLPEFLFTENETNTWRLFNGSANYTTLVKDAFHRRIINGEESATSRQQQGSKMAAHYVVDVVSGGQCTLKCRLMAEDELVSSPFSERAFGAVMDKRKKEADEFYNAVIPDALPKQESLVARQSYAGLLWSKQFYNYVVADWLDGDDDMPPPPHSRKDGRNSCAEWRAMHTRDVVCVPDKWEYPWFSSYEEAMNMLPMAKIDPVFAKKQLLLLLSEDFMSPTGQIPGNETSLEMVVPPVHALACHRVFKITGRKGHRDHVFLARCFQKLLTNYTWWANMKDSSGKSIFGGGFVGLDYDKEEIPRLNEDEKEDDEKEIPDSPNVGPALAEVEGTAWMAFYCVVMLGISLDLAINDPSYEDIATRFLDHFTLLSAVMNHMRDHAPMWDQGDGFYYDHIHENLGTGPLRVRDIRGFIPLLCCAVIDDSQIEKLAKFKQRLDWFTETHVQATKTSTFMDPLGDTQRHRLLAVPTRERLCRMLGYLLNEHEFLSPFGIRSLSLFHKERPVTIVNGRDVLVSTEFTPGEAGVNRNHRGPIWLFMNFLIVEALERYDFFYGDTLKVDFPSCSGNLMRLRDVAIEISKRVTSVFLPDQSGKRPCHGNDLQYTYDVYWNQLVLFYEYFNADTGKGCGASHYFGQSALVTHLLDKIVYNH